MHKFLKTYNKNKLIKYINLPLLFYFLSSNNKMLNKSILDLHNGYNIMNFPMKLGYSVLKRYPILPIFKFRV